jgi:predicted phage baseplate assembly protein
VSGFDGTFGINPDPITGSASPLDDVEQRRKARQRSRTDHALVTTEDIQAAALALPLLEVARAWVLKSDNDTPRTGAVTLVVMRSRPTGDESESPPETAHWLETIRRRLSPQMLLGTRLVVRAPRYVEFSIRAALEADWGRNPSEIEQEVKKELQQRLALVATTTNTTPRQLGVPVTDRDVKTWLRSIDGVRRISQLNLRNADGQNTAQILVPRSGLPRWDVERSAISVNRPEPGGLR